MVDSPGLENRYSLKQRTIEGSNPSLSFFSANRIFHFYLIFFSGMVCDDIAQKKRLDRNEKINKGKENIISI